MKAETIQKIKDAGFSVYMQKGDTSNTYAYFTDGTNIGYIQENEYRGTSISTVHIPCHECGTGYNLTDPYTDANLTPDGLRKAFIHAPSWGSFKSKVQKWRNMEHFLNSNPWNKGFKEV